MDEIDFAMKDYQPRNVDAETIAIRLYTPGQDEYTSYPSGPVNMLPVDYAGIAKSHAENYEENKRSF